MYTPHEFVDVFTRITHHKYILANVMSVSHVRICCCVYTSDIDVFTHVMLICYTCDIDVFTHVMLMCLRM